MDTVESVFGSNVVVFWLDDHIGSDGNCKVLKKKFRENTNILLPFESVEECRKTLPSLKNRQIFCIIQGKYAKEIVPDILKLSDSSQPPFIYIFCLNMMHLIDWADEQPCVKKGGMFDHEQDLLDKLTADLANFAMLKAKEYSLKRTACEDWAKDLASKAKRYRHEKCTLTYADDPLSNKEKSGEEAKELK